MTMNSITFSVLLISLFLLTILSNASRAGSKDEDKIKKLPGQPARGSVTFAAHHGGYVAVDEEAGASFFYYFVESRQPEMPLLLWLNGGPGCSSLGFGAMMEVGPFRVRNDSKTLDPNPYAWNQVANVIFLESPSGVGFSYSNQTIDHMRYSDERTAKQNLIFLLRWLERYPKYKARDFYIEGESYAGHFIPQLAQEILNHNNRRTDQDTRINLKGILIGNPSLDDEIDYNGNLEYLWTHGLMSDETLHKIQKFCSFSNQTGKQCREAMDEAFDATRFLDTYNVILLGAPFSHSLQLQAGLCCKKTRVDPCSRQYVEDYLNNHKVQKALHAKIKGRWSGCSDVILDKWVDRPVTVLPLIKELIAQKLPVWIFSGDWDSVVPLTSTRRALHRLRLPVATEWRAWGLNLQVAGFTIVYHGNLTYVTVREAGHAVPIGQPKQALILVKHFLQGKSLPPVLLD